MRWPLSCKFLLAVALVYGIFSVVLCSVPLPPSKTRHTASYSLTSVDSSHNLLLETPRFTGVIFDQRATDRPATLYPAVTRAFTPTPEEILQAESLLRKCAQGSNMDPQLPIIFPGALYPLEQYYRQYCGYLTTDGKRIIWINAFRKRPGALTGLPRREQRKLLYIQDGGMDNFRIQIHLDLNECAYFVRGSLG